MNNKQLQFIIALTKTQAQLTRRFDRGLGGLGLSEFIILYQVSEAGGGKISRIALAEKIGLTASGVTRLLLPMEKIGLIKRETDKNDARISFVALAPGGRRKLAESLESAELLAAEIIPAGESKNLETCLRMLAELKI